MNANSTPGTPALHAFPHPEDPALCGVDEALLYDPARYERHKLQQLHREPPPAAGPAHPLPADAGWQLPDVIRQRRTHRRFASEPVAQETLARALSVFRQRPDGSGVRSACASTGGLYGVDVYLHVKAGRVAHLEGGVYYYHPASHALHPIAAESAIARDFHHHHNRPVAAASAFTLCFVFNPEVTAPVYGPASHFLACIETGVMLATFNHVAESLGLGLCSVGLVDFARFHAALALPERHQLLHVAEVGPQPAAAPTPPPAAESATAPAEAALTVAGLRRFLADALPDYMVPSQFVVVPEIPLTPNNKVDRAALLKLEDTGALELGTEFARTESDLEAALAAIWQEVLKAERIGIDDNFFDLGGDSMGIAEVRRLIAERCRLDVPILKLFQFPTIRASARHLQTLQPGELVVTEAPRSCAPPHASPCTPMTEEDRQALAWLQANPNHPRAAAVRAKLQQRGHLA